MKIKKVLILLGIGVFFTSCATIRLEHKLEQPIKYWYDLHKDIMRTKVPMWIDDSNRTEATHFLRLPKKIQIKYIQSFWKMREEGLREEFYTRYQIANRVFDEGGAGWKTDRGYILLICGSPQFREVITINDLAFIWTPNPRNGNAQFVTPAYDIDGTVYVIWTYYFGNTWVRFVFTYTLSGYKLDYNSLFNSSNQTRFMDACRKKFSPNEEGWELWGNILLQWVRENETK